MIDAFIIIIYEGKRKQQYQLVVNCMLYVAVIGKYTEIQLYVTEYK